MPETWVATSFGTLDITDLPSYAESRLELMLLPTQPSEPIGLQGDPAALWRRVTEGPVPDSDLSPEHQRLVREFAQFGLASTDPCHPARATSIPKPWLSAPLHELVYSLVASIARDSQVDIVFIKGPALHKQGLREREHSGDVDVWVDPTKVDLLRDALIEWGWTVIPTIWDGHPPAHSTALRPESWGCEVDLHYDLPGIGVSQESAFTHLQLNSETISFAGVHTAIPTVAVHAVLLALHLMRPQTGQPLAAWKRSHVLTALRTAGTNALATAHDFHADAALAPVLSDAFPTEFVHPPYEAPLSWRWCAQPNQIRAFTVLISGLPLAQRIPTALRIIWPSTELTFGHDRAKGHHSMTVTEARCRRVFDAARSVGKRKL